MHSMTNFDDGWGCDESLGDVNEFSKEQSKNNNFYHNCSESLFNLINFFESEKCEIKSWKNHTLRFFWWKMVIQFFWKGITIRVHLCVDNQHMFKWVSNRVSLVYSQNSTLQKLSKLYFPTFIVTHDWTNIMISTVWQTIIFKPQTLS